MKTLARPNLFIIGAPKCGTTALAHYLGEHPSVFFCQPKEPFFWDTDHANCRKTHDLPTENAYLKLFAAANPDKHTVIGEGSTTYLQSYDAVPNILKFNPVAKFLVMLRNPLEVAYGMHGELLRHFYEDVRDFETAWRLQTDRAHGRSLPQNPHLPHQLQYQQVASFGPQLERFFKLVPENQRLVVFFDDFARDTAQTYQATLRFLGLDNDGRCHFPKVNEARHYRYEWLGRFYHAPPQLLERPVRFFRSQFMRHSGPAKWLLSRLVSHKQPRAALSPEFQLELKQVFQEDVVSTSRLVGRDLTHWLA